MIPLAGRSVSDFTWMICSVFTAPDMVTPTGGASNSSATPVIELPSTDCASVTLLNVTGSSFPSTSRAIIVTVSPHPSALLRSMSSKLNATSVIGAEKLNDAIFG